MQVASLDHAMWFHRPIQVDQWLLYAIDSPSASQARGFARGNIFTESGELIASTTQEGLIRLRNPRPWRAGLATANRLDCAAAHIGPRAPWRHCQQSSR